MSPPKTVHGGYFLVAVEADPTNAPGDFTIICGLNSKTLAHQSSTSTEAVPDCGNPEAVPWDDLVVNSQSKQMSGTGLHNRAQTALLRSILMKTLTYRFIEGEPGTDLVGQGYWEGKFTLTTWTEGATVFKGNVTSDFTWPSSGEPLWYDTSAPVLGTITMLPLTATVATPWTGTVSGVSDMSELTVSAPGATAVSVVGNTIKATWATAGSKTVTVTESDPEATNSPKATAFTVVVS
jgi:hypothetical protein